MLGRFRESFDAAVLLRSAALDQAQVSQCHSVCSILPRRNVQILLWPNAVASVSLLRCNSLVTMLLCSVKASLGQAAAVLLQPIPIFLVVLACLGRARVRHNAAPEGRRPDPERRCGTSSSEEEAQS